MRENTNEDGMKPGLETVLLTRNHPDEQFAIPMGLIRRIEEVAIDRIDSIAGQKVLQNRGASMPLLSLEDLIDAKSGSAEDRVTIVVFEVIEREVGLIVHEIRDLCEVDLESDNALHRERGVMGSIVVGDKPTRVINLGELAEVALTDWFEDHALSMDDASHKPTILLAEDSKFFRKQLVELFLSKGFEVIDCEDGQAAWETLQQETTVDIVVTDLEMPRLDGFGLSQKIKQHPVYKSLPVIALTSLSSEEHRLHALKCGVDEYQMKMNQPELLSSVVELLRKSEASSELQMAT